MQLDSEKPDKITRGACACSDDKVIFENPLISSAAVFRAPGMNKDLRVWDGTCPAPGGLSKKLHAKVAAEKQQSITLVNQSFDERKIVVLRSDASDKTAKQNESDDHFRLADDPEPNWHNANATNDWHSLEVQVPAIAIPFLKVTM
jgi:hypothetical protein